MNVVFWRTQRLANSAFYRGTRIGWCLAVVLESGLKQGIMLRYECALRVGQCTRCGCARMRRSRRLQRKPGRMIPSCASRMYGPRISPRSHQNPPNIGHPSAEARSNQPGTQPARSTARTMLSTSRLSTRLRRAGACAGRSMQLVDRGASAIRSRAA